MVASQAENSSTLKTISKLVVNAATKGQSEDGSKFRTIRLANKTIQNKVMSVSGSLELLLAVGFVLQEKDDEVRLRSNIILPIRNSRRYTSHPRT